MVLVLVVMLVHRDRSIRDYSDLYALVALAPAGDLLADLAPAGNSFST
jgi:hypothetical protein